MSVFDQVKKVIVAKIGAPPEYVTMESSMTDDLGCDELDLAELVMAFEQEFEVIITDDSAEKFKTVKDIVDYVSKTKAKK